MLLVWEDMDSKIGTQPKATSMTTLRIAAYKAVHNDEYILFFKRKAFHEACGFKDLLRLEFMAKWNIVIFSHSDEQQRQRKIANFILE